MSNIVRQALRGTYHRLPEGMRRAILVRRRESIWLDRGILFIHIPKAAGTSMNSALYGRFMGHVRASEILKWGSQRLRSLPRFCVTRNPWDRLVSAYRFARRGIGKGGIVAGMSHPERYQGLEFEGFERFVNKWLAPRDIAKLDGVFQPQWLFLCDQDGKLLVDHVGRLEDLGPTYAFIERHVGPIKPIPRANRSGDEVDYRAFYTRELAKLVGDIYRTDVDLFGYDF